jgi:hypothetical protein
MLNRYAARVLALFIVGLATSNPVSADWFISFNNTDFGITETFNEVNDFRFDVRLAGDPTVGVFSNPMILDVDYRVFGKLPQTTPSGFGAFLLLREHFDGTEFYAQGSSMNFEIGAGTDFSDGVQFSELMGDVVMDFREVGTGRYHPPIINLNADGTGRIQNSNNMGGINPSTNLEVDVTYGEEYIWDLSFDPAAFTFAAVPEPSSLLTLGMGAGWMALRRRRR